MCIVVGVYYVVIVVKIKTISRTYSSVVSGSAVFAEVAGSWLADLNSVVFCVSSLLSEILLVKRAAL